MPLESKSKGFSAHICCDDKELEMYDIQHEDDKTVSCWVASEAGKAFSVRWGDESAQQNMQVAVCIDGRRARQVAHTPNKTGSVTGVFEGRDKFRQFVFAPLVLTDDERLGSSKVNPELGTIQIKLRRAKGWIDTDTLYEGSKFTEIGPVHERSKKAGVHTVALGDVQPTKPTITCTALGLENEPFAIFTFRYRPLGLLQANGIAPLPPPPLKGKKRPSDSQDNPNAGDPKRRREDSPVKPDPGTDDENDPDDDDVVFLQEQLAMIKQRLKEAKAARRPRTIVKREASPIRVPSSSSHEVIDLT